MISYLNIEVISYIQLCNRLCQQAFLLIAPPDFRGPFQTLQDRTDQKLGGNIMFQNLCSPPCFRGYCSAGAVGWQHSQTSLFRHTELLYFPKKPTNFVNTYHSAYRQNIKCQKCTGMGLNGFHIKQVDIRHTGQLKK